MTHPLEGARGFLRYNALRAAGVSTAEIEAEVAQEMVAGQRRDLELRIELASERLFNRASPRIDDGEEVCAEMEEYPDITIAAGRRIALAEEDSVALVAEGEELNRRLAELTRKMKVNHANKISLERCLDQLRFELASSTSEPSWMEPGSLEKLREMGRIFGEAQARKAYGRGK